MESELAIFTVLDHPPTRKSNTIRLKLWTQLNWWSTRILEPIQFLDPHPWSQEHPSRFRKVLELSIKIPFKLYINCIKLIDVPQVPQILVLDMYKCRTSATQVPRLFSSLNLNYSTTCYRPIWRPSISAHSSQTISLATVVNDTTSLATVINDTTSLATVIDDTTSTQLRGFGDDTPVNLFVDDTAVILKLVTILLSTCLLTIPPGQPVCWRYRCQPVCWRYRLVNLLLTIPPGQPVCWR